MRTNYALVGLIILVLNTQSLQSAARCDEQTQTLSEIKNINKTTKKQHTEIKQLLTGLDHKLDLIHKDNQELKEFLISSRQISDESTQRHAALAEKFTKKSTHQEHITTKE